MKLFLLLLCCFAGLALVSGDLIQFASMIKHKTGKSELAYKGYGCYCGPGGSKQPLDETDWCCHAHDCCYNKLSSSRCRPDQVTYKYFTLGSRIICGSISPCERRSCECDRQAAECFQRAARTYNNYYKNYHNFLCRGRTPSC